MLRLEELQPNRKEQLEKQLRELEQHLPGSSGASRKVDAPYIGPLFDADDLEDLDDAPDPEVAAIEEEILDQATAARSIQELKAEIATLAQLEMLALAVRRSGEDRKWRELAGLLNEIFTPAALAGRIGEERSPHGAGLIPLPTPSPQQKLVLFTEHRDTLNYLAARITTLLGRNNAVVVIHGGMGRRKIASVGHCLRRDERTLMRTIRKFEAKQVSYPG